ncbi:FN3 domain and signal peptide containing protein [Cryptosporidium canis]|uniref:FN3 domain and signal peptide containing protein n=1 Tax=Cryptosporidium canis TaxID=195482 RepID=A0A9D5DE89_9CRYT|nr:FN3 domain and signal peptide containing protein [Cryptosporidium canis]
MAFRIALCKLILLFLISGADSVAPANTEDDQLISVRTSLFNEISVLELVKIENEKIGPKKVNLEFYWERFEINDIDQRVCYYIRLKGTPKSPTGLSGSRSSPLICENSLLEIPFSARPVGFEELQDKMAQLSEGLVRFFDYEYDQSRPAGGSSLEQSQWRATQYNKLKLNGLVVPGKGSSRLYIRVDTNLAYVGNYFGYLKIEYENSVELNPVRLSVDPPPWSIVKDGEQQVSMDEKKVVFGFRIGNNFALRNVDILIRARLKDRCLVRKDSSTETPVLEIRSGELERIMVECNTEGTDARSLMGMLSVEINGFWRGSGRYKRTYKYADMMRHNAPFERGVFLSKSSPSYQDSDGYFLASVINSEKNKVKVLTESSKEVMKYKVGDVLFAKYWIMIDLLEISREILGLRNVKILVKVESSSLESLNVSFDGNDAMQIYHLDSVTEMNSLQFWMVRVKLDTSSMLNGICQLKGEELQILANVKVVEESNNTLEGMELLEKTYVFNLDVESKHEEFVIGNCIRRSKSKGERILVKSLDETIDLNFVRIKSPEKTETGDVEIGLLRLEGNDLALVSKIGSLRVGKHELARFNVNLKGLIDTDLFEGRQADSARSGSIENLPYFISVGNDQKLHLATVANCGKVKVDKKEIDFGTVPVSLFGDTQLVRELKLSIKRFGGKDWCSKNVSLGFSIQRDFKLTVMLRRSSIIENKLECRSVDGGDAELTKRHVCNVHVEDLEDLSLLIEPDFSSPIQVEHAGTRDISAQLEIYTVLTMLDDGGSRVAILDKKLPPISDFPEISLFFMGLVGIACTVRGLHVSAGTPHIRNALHSEIMSHELIRGGRLPISLFLVNIKNEEEFPVQYSLQRAEGGVSNDGKGNRGYFAQDYTFYVSYENSREGEWAESLDVFEQNFSISEGKAFAEHVSEKTELFDNLAFNFPFKNLYLMNVVFVLRLGMVCLYNGEVFAHEGSFCIELLPVGIAERVGNLKISMGHLKLNIWQVVIKFDMNLGSTEVVTGLRFYETGRMDWHFCGSLVEISDSFGMFIPRFISDMDFESAFELKEVVEYRRVRRVVRVSTVPWLEVSTEIPRSGYLLPKENRLIAILVHNQIVTSSSIRSRARKLNCSYNLVLKGLTDTREALDGLADPFSRFLLENDQELRQENLGMRSLFPLDWTVSNVVHELGYGGGFVKRITLVDSPTFRVRQDLSSVEYIQFVVEIQNPILCMNGVGESDPSQGELDYLDEDEAETSFEEYGSGGGRVLGGKICTPFSNIEAVKGFRIIWYPYNNFSPTDYRSVEILITDVPKYDFRTGSYSFESTRQREEEESSEVGRIFTEYVKDANSEDSEVAYLLRVNYAFILNQQYTFKFALTHHNDIKNSVFVPPFGFNVTAQNHSLRWLRSLKSVGSRVSESQLLSTLAQRICKGRMSTFSDNTLVLSWDEDFLKMVRVFSVSYLEVDAIPEELEEWRVADSISELAKGGEEPTSTDGKKLLFVAGGQKSDDGVSKFFYRDAGNGGSLSIRVQDIPSSSKLRIVVDMVDYSSEKFRCVSRAFQTPRGVPTQPEGFQSTPLTISSVKLSWSAPKSKGGSDISEYLIVLSPELVSFPRKYKIENITISTDKLMTISDQMFPLVTYRAAIQARNEFGLGRPSVIDHVMSRGVQSCRSTGSYQLLINEGSRRQISWLVDPPDVGDLKSSLIYVYCSKRGHLTLGRLPLVELLEASDACRTEGGHSICTWVERSEELEASRCESFSFKVVRVADRPGSGDLSCLQELGSQKVRRLRGDSDGGGASGRMIKVHHMGSGSGWRERGERRTQPYYPRGYNPRWDNGLAKAIIEMNLSSPNSSLVEVEINYLYEAEGLEEIMFRGKVGSVWYDKYYYDLESSGDLGTTRSWSIFGSAHKTPRREEIELVVLNLIPGMTVMASIRELDRNNTAISTSRHVLRVPERGRRVDLKNRRLLGSGILRVQVDRRFGPKEGGGKLRSLGEHGERVVTLSVSTDTSSVGGSLSNSLFVSSRMLVEGWPEDFERRLFGRVDVSLHSGHFEFQGGLRQINESMVDYWPVSEQKSHGGNVSDGRISGLFDGDPETGIRFYHNGSGGDLRAKGIKTVLEEEYFPHISLRFDPPICILYARLHWEGSRSPVSTMVSVGLRSRSDPKQRVRSYNPVVHECFEEASGGERVDTIQIIPPEELVNTYLANPSKRYPRVHNFTLYFAGSCGRSRARQKRDAVELFLREVEIAPCISNDLALSYSDPLSESSANLVRSEHLVEESRLRERYSEIQRVILESLGGGANRNLTDLEMNDLSAKYSKPVSEARIYLDLHAVLSEESSVRSEHIPSTRVLIQDSAGQEGPSGAGSGQRRLAEAPDGGAPSPGLGHSLYWWLSLALVSAWGWTYISKRQNRASSCQVQA